MKKPLTEANLGYGIATRGSRVTWLDPESTNVEQNKQFLKNARQQHGAGPFIVKGLRRTINKQVLVVFNSDYNVCLEINSLWLKEIRWPEPKKE